MTWFICTDERVEGPFTAEAVKGLWDGGSLTDESIVWGRGHSDWVKVKNWVNSEESKIDIQNSKLSSQLWHYALNGESKGPMTRGELMHELRNIRDKDQILLWTKGMKAWADLFEFHDILNELGLDKRTDPRADIQGTLTIEMEKGGKVLGQLRTISTGGLGATGVSGQLSVGQSIQVEIQSGQLSVPIRAKTIVQYITDLGFVGLKFESLSMEAKSQILQHIRISKEALPEAA